MTSDPSRLKTGTVTASMATAPASTNHFQRSAQAHTGSYRRIRIRLMGWFSSEWIFPTSTALAARQIHAGRKRKLFLCVNHNHNTRASVKARTAATIMDRFLVYASGLNSRPSCASSVSTGRKETAITSNAKKLVPPTRSEEHTSELQSLRHLVCR